MELLVQRVTYFLFVLINGATVSCQYRAVRIALSISPFGVESQPVQLKHALILMNYQIFHSGGNLPGGALESMICTDGAAVTQQFSSFALSVWSRSDAVTAHAYARRFCIITFGIS